MKKIWNYLKNHVREDFNLKHYASVAFLLGVILSLNYYFDFEDGYLDRLTGFKKFNIYFLTYSIPYFISVLLFSKFQNKRGLFSNKWFWIITLFGISILSLDSSVPFLQPIIQSLFPRELIFWTFKVAVNMISFITIFIPIIIFYFLFEKSDNTLYGLKPRKFNARPYFIMLLILLPGIILASTTPAFLKQYPMYKSSVAHTYLQLNEWVTVAVYELAYGLDFITVEYLFRGFLVISLIPILGRGAVLSMAVIYCVLHFGKPAGEAISSIFGGYILGVVAYETRSVWGGVIVHMGLAWLMELMAFIAKY
jgi:hypothetical protein